MITGDTASVRIYKNIKESCMSIPEVKHFALWNNQLNKVKDGDEKLFRYPAVFVQFENDYNQLSTGVQEINGTFILYICLQSLNQNDEFVLRFKDYIYQQLTRTLPAKGFGDFYRVHELQDVDRDNLLVWYQEYSYSYIDDTAKDVYTILHPYNTDQEVHY